MLSIYWTWAINVLLLPGIFCLDNDGDIEARVMKIVTSIYKADQHQLQNKIAEQDKQIEYLLHRDEQREKEFGELLKKLDEQDDRRHSTHELRRSSNVVTRAVVNGETIGFMAYMDHIIDHMDIGHTVRANQILLNDGGAYNNKTGVFTVPVSGVYLFNYHYNSHYRKTIVGLFVDGKHVVDAISVPKDATQEIMAGNTALINLQTGQSVWLEEILAIDGEIYSTPAARYATFSGVLLY